jgi:hypothetical protein
VNAINPTQGLLRLQHAGADRGRGADRGPAGWLARRALLALNTPPSPRQAPVVRRRAPDSLFPSIFRPLRSITDSRKERRNSYPQGYSVRLTGSGFYWVFGVQQCVDVRRLDPPPADSDPPLRPAHQTEIARGVQCPLDRADGAARAATRGDRLMRREDPAGASEGLEEEEAAGMTPCQAPGAGGCVNLGNPRISVHQRSPAEMRKRS